MVQFSRLRGVVLGVLALGIVVSAGAALLKHSARVEITSALLGVARGERAVASIAQNPTLLSSNMAEALPRILARGFEVNAGALYFREPGVLFHVALGADRELLCLVRGLIDRVIFCADVAKQSVAS